MRIRSVTGRICVGHLVCMGSLEHVKWATRSSRAGLVSASGFEGSSSELNQSLGRLADELSSLRSSSG